MTGTVVGLGTRVRAVGDHIMLIPVSCHIRDGLVLPRGNSASDFIIIIIIIIIKSDM